MGKIYSLTSSAKTRLHILCTLVFFAAINSACNRSSGQKGLSIIKDRETYSAVFIPFDSIPGVDKNRLEKEIIVKLEGSRENMLGRYTFNNDGVIFKPLIGLTPGNTYQVVFKGRALTNLTVPQVKKSGATKLTAIYPSADTLPENLLKIYLKFSKPMRRGVSGQYLSMLNEKGDTLKNIFLNLDSELWDEEGRQLTVWLDPGRIKRGLQPNERDGNPLQKGSVYTFAVSTEWTDLQGAKLNKPYTKKFIAVAKDIQSPDPSTWIIKIPKSSSRQALSISFPEALDFALLYNTISIVQPGGHTFNGEMKVNNKEHSLLFYPKTNWKRGTYHFKIDSKLEDLAGNNLNRLFDRDLMKDQNPVAKDRYYTRQFIVD